MGKYRQVLGRNLGKVGQILLEKARAGVRPDPLTPSCLRPWCTFNVIGEFGEFSGNGSFADIPTHMISAITFDSDILVSFIIARWKTILKGYKIELKFL